MKTTENNKIIAEFMGNRNYLYNNDKNAMYFILINTVGEELIVNYDNDWGLLMEVVEKIESIGFTFETKKNWARITRKGENIILRWEEDKTKIEAVYNACIEFIKWYNENKD